MNECNEQLTLICSITGTRRTYHYLDVVGAHHCNTNCVALIGYGRSQLSAPRVIALYATLEDADAWCDQLAAGGTYVQHGQVFARGDQFRIL